MHERTYRHGDRPGHLVLKRRRGECCGVTAGCQRPHFDRYRRGVDAAELTHGRRIRRAYGQAADFTELLVKQAGEITAACKVRLLSFAPRHEEDLRRGRASRRGG